MYEIEHAYYKCVQASGTLIQSSSLAMSSIDISECRICFSSDGQLLSPCLCSGTMAHIHYNCLKQLIEINGENNCRICGHNWIGFELIATEMNFSDYLRTHVHQRVDIFLIIIGLIIDLLAVLMLLYLRAQIIAISPDSIDKYKNQIYIYRIGAFVSFITVIAISLIIVTLIVNNKTIINDYKIWKQNNFKYKLLHYNYNISII